MKIVADTNVFMAVALGEPERDSIVTATRGAELIAPDILPCEIGNALSSLFRRGILIQSQVRATWEATRRIPVECRPVDIRRALDIAVQHRIYAYDAYFIECALRAGCPLLTLDRRMRVIAESMRIEIVKAGEA